MIAHERTLTIVGVVFFFLLALPVVHGLIVDPGRIIQGYDVQRDEYNYTFSLTNDGDEDVIIVSTFEGVLKDSMRGSVDRLFIRARQTENYYLSVNIPAPLAPGRAESQVRFFQVPRQSSGVGATVAIRVGVFFDVPQVPKYLVPAILSILPVAPGNDVVVPVSIQHSGTEVIGSADGTLAVDTINETRLIPAFSLSLLIPGDYRVFNITVPTSDWLPGIYSAKLLVDYDEESINTSEYKFVIGAKSFVFNSFSPLSASIGIIPITFSLKNLWGTQVSPLVTLHVLKDGRVIRTQELGKFDIPSLSEKSISQFLNVADLSAGEYTIQLRANEGDVQTQKEYVLLLSIPIHPSNEVSLGISNLQMILLGIIVLLVISGIVVWYKSRA